MRVIDGDVLGAFATRFSVDKLRVDLGHYCRSDAEGRILDWICKRFDVYF